MYSVRNIAPGLAFGALLALAPMAASAAEAPDGSSKASAAFQVAQLNLQFGGGSGNRARRALRRNGYTEIEIVKTGLTKVRARACRDGVRYQIEMTPSGRIRNRGKIGDCRPPITIEQAQRILERKGYTRINLEEQGDVPYVAIACKGRNRYRVNVNLYGDVSEDARIGRCRRRLSIEEVAAKLRDEGYDRIKFTDKRPPRYEVEACQRNRRHELVVNRRGIIVANNTIGRCDPPIDPKNIEQILADNGYDRIEVFDRKLPRYEAEGCLGNDRMEVFMNRYGEIVRKTKVGDCQAPVSARDVRRHLRDNGLKKISVEEADGGEFLAIACQDDDRIRFRFSKYGEVLDQRTLGPCSSPSLERVGQRYSRRRYKDLKYFIEGCRGRRLYRIQVDEYGQQIERERIGRCTN